MLFSNSTRYSASDIDVFQTSASLLYISHAYGKILGWLFRGYFVIFCGYFLYFKTSLPKLKSDAFFELYALFCIGLDVFQTSASLLYISHSYGKILGWLFRGYFLYFKTSLPKLKSDAFFELYALFCIGLDVFQTSASLLYISHAYGKILGWLFRGYLVIFCGYFLLFQNESTQTQIWCFFRTLRVILHRIRCISNICIAFIYLSLIREDSRLTVSRLFGYFLRLFSIISKRVYPNSNLMLFSNSTRYSASD